MRGPGGGGRCLARDGLGRRDVEGQRVRPRVDRGDLGGQAGQLGLLGDGHQVGLHGLDFCGFHRRSIPARARNIQRDVPPAVLR